MLAFSFVSFLSLMSKEGFKHTSLGDVEKYFKPVSDTATFDKCVKDRKYHRVFLTKQPATFAVDIDVDTQEILLLSMATDAVRVESELAAYIQFMGVGSQNVTVKDVRCS